VPKDRSARATSDPLLVKCPIAACGLRSAEGKWNMRNVTAEWWVICGMRKVALLAVECIFTCGNVM